MRDRIIAGLLAALLLYAGLIGAAVYRTARRGGRRGRREVVTCTVTLPSLHVQCTISSR